MEWYHPLFFARHPCLGELGQLSGSVAKLVKLGDNVGAEKQERPARNRLQNSARHQFFLGVHIMI